MGLFRRNCILQVGVAAVQLAHCRGMRVIGTAGTAEGEEVVKQAGASLVFNHKKDGYVQHILVSPSQHVTINGHYFVIYCMCETRLKTAKVVGWNPVQHTCIMLLGGSSSFEKEPLSELFHIAP